MFEAIALVRVCHTEMHHTRPARVITALNRSVSCVLPCNYVARGAMAASPHAACRIARRSHSSLPRDASAPSEPLGNQSTTHFGFKTIPEEVKESLGAYGQQASWTTPKRV